MTLTEAAPRVGTAAPADRRRPPPGSVLNSVSATTGSITCRRPKSPKSGRRQQRSRRAGSTSSISSHTISRCQNSPGARQPRDEILSGAASRCCAGCRSRTSRSPTAPPLLGHRPLISVTPYRRTPRATCSGMFAISDWRPAIRTSAPTRRRAPAFPHRFVRHRSGCCA